MLNMSSRFYSERFCALFAAQIVTLDKDCKVQMAAHISQVFSDYKSNLSSFPLIMIEMHLV